MGIVKASIAGEIRGKLGNVVIYKVGEQLRVRTAPGRVKDPKTPGQLAHRARVRGMASLFHQLDRQLYYYWKELTEGTGMNAYNLFVSKNIKNMTGEGEVADVSEMCLTQGDIAEPYQLTTERNPEQVTLRWERGEDEGSCASLDVLQIAVYAPQAAKREKIWLQTEFAAQRKDKSYTWPVPQEIEGPFHAFGLFKNRYNNEVSMSFYIGSFNGTKEQGSSED